MLKTVAEVASIATKFLSNSDNKPSGNYNIRGHINNCPVDIQVDSAPRPQSSTSGTSQAVHHNNDVFRSPPSCNSCKSNSIKNASKNKQQNNKKPNENNKKPNDNNSKICQVLVPDKGNYKISIEKTESSPTVVNSATPGSTQNWQKQKQPYGNQQQRQNGNNKQQNWNQQNNGNNKQQNGNYKQQQTGNQRQQDGNNKQQTWNSKQQTGNPKKNFNGTNKQLNNTGNQNNYTPKINVQNCNTKPYGANGQRSVPSNGNNTWMYLGRLKIGTTESDIQTYLNTKFPGHHFIVQSLPLYKDAKLPCFKVRVDNRILGEFQNTNNWPNGVTITKFIENFKS